jgi:hypothetical protein
MESRHIVSFSSDIIILFLMGAVIWYGLTVMAF